MIYSYIWPYINIVSMRIYFNNSVCKKCPYGEFPTCYYKETFYKLVPKRKSKLKLIHKCQYYRKIFRKGQLVLIDLQHRVPDENGEWELVTVRRDVPGFITGMRGSNFVVELFEVVALNDKKAEKAGKVELKRTLTILKPAREIRRLLIKEQQVRRLYPLHVAQSSLIFN